MGKTTVKQEAFGEVNDHQIEMWKKEFGGVYLAKTKGSNGEELFFYMKKPDMNIMDMYVKEAEAHPVLAGALLFKNCVIDKAQVHYADDVDVMNSIMPYLNSMVERREASIKKL